jgi:hypothetical protein
LENNRNNGIYAMGQLVATSTATDKAYWRNFREFAFDTIGGDKKLLDNNAKK